MVEHTETPIIILVCLIVVLTFYRIISHAVVRVVAYSTGFLKKEKIFLLSKLTVEKFQSEDNKTEEESNPSPKLTSSVFQEEENEDTEDDTTYWADKYDNSKKLFQEALVVKSSLWECKQCTFINTSNKIHCEICGDSNGRVRRVSLLPSLSSPILFSVSSYLSHL